MRPTTWQRKRSIRSETSVHVSRLKSTRVTPKIEVSGTDDAREILKAMMQATVGRHRKHWSDAVSVKLWNYYESDSVIQNSIDYAPDGCGWSGDPCSQPI